MLFNFNQIALPRGGTKDELQAIKGKRYLCLSVYSWGFIGVLLQERLLIPAVEPYRNQLAKQKCGMQNPSSSIIETDWGWGLELMGNNLTCSSKLLRNMIPKDVFSDLFCSHCLCGILACCYKNT